METIAVISKEQKASFTEHFSKNSQRPQISALTDSQLYTLCKEYGKNARKWQREFAFLLPEVAERRLHLRRNYQSIYEFAGKLAGMSYEVTKRVLSLHGKLKDKPIIWNSFQKYGWTKLKLIANLVDFESEEFWLDKLERLPREALNEYIKVWKIKNNLNENQAENLFSLGSKNFEEVVKNGLEEGKSVGTLNLGTEKLDDFKTEAQSLQAPTYTKLKFNVDRKTEFQLRNFQKELSKELHESLTLGETLKAVFAELQELRKFKEEMTTKPKCKKKEMKAVENKTEKAESKKSNQQKPANPQKISSKPVSRTIPAQLKREILQQYNHRCSEPSCNKPYSEIHHPNYFALNPNHENLKPLCHVHHQLAHAGVNVENQHELTQDSMSELIDKEVRKHWT